MSLYWSPPDEGYGRGDRFRAFRLAAQTHSAEMLHYLVLLRYLDMRLSLVLFGDMPRH